MTARRKPRDRDGIGSAAKEPQKGAMPMAKNKEHAAQVKALQERFVTTAHVMFGREIDELTPHEIYRTIAATTRELLSENWIKTNKTYQAKKAKQVYYFSIEFLLGRLLNSNLINLGVKDLMEEALGGLNLSLARYMTEEPDAGLGNGGLGRLAACFIDSMAALALPGNGCSIRYQYGLFEQKIIDGNQVELPDKWLRDGFVWEYRKPDKAVNVRFGGNAYMKEQPDGSLKLIYEDYTTVMAVPYDVPIVGANNHTVNTLRLWNAEVDKDFITFGGMLTHEQMQERTRYRNYVENITHFLYPNDSTEEGRRLRLIQEYFFVSAGVQSIVRHQKKEGIMLHELPDRIAIHINDTHPALAVAELMRILVDDENMPWEEAWQVTTGVMAYTNHTIMPEALERWSVSMLRPMLPRIYMIIDEINKRFLKHVRRRYPGDEERVRSLSIIQDDQVHMARLAIVGSHSVNGVAAIHSDILKHTTLRPFFEFYPGKFNNKTNGITHRRWLIGANPELAEFLDEKLTPAWRKEPEKLEGLAKFKDDPAVLSRLAEIKLSRKKILARRVREHTGLRLDPETMFDIQVKRIHSYKRQLMNVLHIMFQYDRLRRGKDDGIIPTTYFFGGKAAPGYYIAKETIRLICAVAERVNDDPVTNKMLKVVFIENFGVSIGEVVYPAADVSEQISTASKEASGTGNMKFMMNGAITLGTMDGANVEIHEAVGGDEHCVIFGLTAEEVMDFYANGAYSAWDEYNRNESVRRVLDRLVDGTYGDFRSLFDYLLQNNDEFFILKDFDAYRIGHEEIMRRYHDRTAWNRSMLMNIAMSGRFSSDRTIEEYAKEIWHLKPIHIG